MHITEERIAEIVDWLNDSPERQRRPATLGIWSWKIRKLPEFDEDKSVDAGASADNIDLFALADGTVIRYDHTAGLWRVTGRDEYCPACRVPEHDTCSMTPGCPCCDNTHRAMLEHDQYLLRKSTYND